MQSMRRYVHEWFDGDFFLTGFFHDLFFPISQGAASLRVFAHLAGKLRRFWLVHFRKHYVQRQLMLRQGACRQCGTCCNLLFTCPMLTCQGTCLVYGVCRPQACKVFPIDARDTAEVGLCGRSCGYRFERNDSSGIRELGRESSECTHPPLPLMNS